MKVVNLLILKGVDKNQMDSYYTGMASSSPQSGMARFWLNIGKERICQIKAWKKL